MQVVIPRFASADVRGRVSSCLRARQRPRHHGADGIATLGVGSRLARREQLRTDQYASTAARTAAARHVSRSTLPTIVGRTASCHRLDAQQQDAADRQQVLQAGHHHLVDAQPRQRPAHPHHARTPAASP